MADETFGAFNKPKGRQVANLLEPSYVRFKDMEPPTNSKPADHQKDALNSLEFKLIYSHSDVHVPSDGPLALTLAPCDVIALAEAILCRCSAASRED